MTHILFTIITSLFFFGTCNVNKEPLTREQYDGIYLEELKLPPGFEVSVYAQNIENARSMSLSPNGTLFVSTRTKGNVYALEDINMDYEVDKVHTLLSGATLPNGVAYKDGDLYVALVDRILRYNNIESNMEQPEEPEIIYDQFPTERHHGWKFISFGPDDKLYVPVGAPCNICESDEPIFSTITRMNPDGSDFEIVQFGVRNTVGFTWHPVTNELWFTDNGRDMLGDDLPACELNHAPKDGMHFGFPYCHQGDLPDEEYGHKRPCEEFVRPVQNLGAHVAPLGCEFFKSSSFPDQYKDYIFIAEHGSWNRSKKSGYKISMVKLNDNNEAIEYSDFITGWLDKSNDESWGRPVDLEWMPDGSMLISDDYANVIYRVSYKG